MDTAKYTSKGVMNGFTFTLKTVRSEEYDECTVCHLKSLDPEEFSEHQLKMNHSGYMTAGGGEDHNQLKFNGTHYCSKCGLQKN